MNLKDKLSTKVKGIPVFAVVLLVVSGLGAAALVNHFASVEANVNVKPAVKIDSITWEGSNFEVNDNDACTWDSGSEHTAITCNGLSGVQQGEGAVFEVHTTNEADEEISAVGKVTWSKENSNDDADDFETFKVRECPPDGEEGTCNEWWNLDTSDEFPDLHRDENGDALVMYYGTQDSYVSTGDSTFDFEVELADAIETGDYDLTFEIIPVRVAENEGVFSQG